jgi:hypothetical protein
LSAALDRVAGGGRLDVPVDPLEVAELLWSTLDTPLSLGLSLLVKNGQIADALAVKFSPGRYLEQDVGTARDDYQAIAFLQKCPLEIKGVDREVAAFQKFMDAEEQCRKTNARLRSAREGTGNQSPRVTAVFDMAARKILSWVGPRVDARSWLLRCRFGPGSDALNTGACAQAYHKLSRMSVTADFYEGAQAVVLSQPGWYRHQVMVVGENSSSAAMEMRVVPGNKVTFVPKTALIDRSIAVEPGMNIYAQLGLGALLRASLKKAGLDLDNADPNRGLAIDGSIHGAVATIDLSSASDTLARELVRELLPDHWFLALDWVRSKVGVYTSPGGMKISFRYEKFSSMGNGYTFELESMIFYALALACTEYCRDDTSLVRAFGDDITVPTGVVPLLEEVLAAAGFTFNLAKSFSSGLFRESCGMDFFNGVNVRPYFLKEFPLGTVQSLFRVANGIRRAAARRNLGFGCDRKLKPVWNRLLARIPRSFRSITAPPVPVTFRDKRLANEAEWTEIDGTLLGNYWEGLVSPYVTFNRDYGKGWNYCAYRGAPRSIRAADFHQLTSFALYGARDGGTDLDNTTLDKITIRGEGRAKLRRGYAPLWPDLGDWVKSPIT